MSQDDLSKIMTELRQNRSEQEKVHKKMRDDMDDIKIQLKPIFEIYSQFQGFGSVVSWVFKFLIIPLSILVGVWISIKQLR